MLLDSAGMPKPMTRSESVSDSTEVSVGVVPTDIDAMVSYPQFAHLCSVLDLIIYFGACMVNAAATVFRVATLLENLEKSGNWKVVREKSGKMNYYKYSVAASIVQT